MNIPKLALATIVVAVAMSHTLSAIAQPRVSTTTGEVEGRLINGLHVFKGIPYAKPPVGNLRWRSPQPPEKNTGVLRAYEYGADCPQARRLSPNQSEDCLFLNVWAPQDASTNKYPVMVWIHGGGFINGSGKINGEAFAKQGIVFVSINYRLGKLGSFAHPALLSQLSSGEPSTNFWLLDQIAALRWVQKNIGAFGGDRDRVTIFGVSAGGTSVNMLMASSQARGLFQRAISQSGISGYLPLQRVDRTYQGVPSQVSMGESFAIKRNIANRPDAANALRALPWQEIAKDTSGVGPVVDGVLIPDDLRTIFRQGKQQTVPFIAGANSYEGNLSFVLPWGEEPLKQLIRQNLDRLAPLYGKTANDSSLWIDLYGDVFFRTSANYLVSQMAQVQTPAWHYHFDYVYQSLREYTPGAGHASEVMFLFGNLPRSPWRPGAVLAGLLKIPNKPYPIVEADREMSRLMQGHWIQFAKTGDPNGAGLPKWSNYTPSSPVTLVYGQRGIQEVNNLDREKFKLLFSLFDTFLSASVPNSVPAQLSP